MITPRPRVKAMDSDIEKDVKQLRGWAKRLAKRLQSNHRLNSTEWAVLNPCPDCSAAIKRLGIQYPATTFSLCQMHDSARQAFEAFRADPNDQTRFGLAEALERLQRHLVETADAITMNMEADAEVSLRDILAMIEAASHDAPDKKTLRKLIGEPTAKRSQTGVWKWSGVRGIVEAKYPGVPKIPKKAVRKPRKTREVSRTRPN